MKMVFSLFSFITNNLLFWCFDCFSYLAYYDVFVFFQNCMLSNFFCLALFCLFILSAASEALCFIVLFWEREKGDTTA